MFRWLGHGGDFRVQASTAMKRNCHPETAFAVDPMTALRAEEFEARGQQCALSLDRRPPV
jgi:hypothetical protein